MNSLVFLQCNEINASFYREQFCIRCKYIYVYICLKVKSFLILLVTLQSWFNWNTSIKRGHKVCRVYVFVHICMCMWVCFFLYKYIYIYVCVCVYMYMSIYVSGFPNWDIVMRGQTYRRERQVYLYTCHEIVLIPVTLSRGALLW